MGGQFSVDTVMQRENERGRSDVVCESWCDPRWCNPGIQCRSTPVQVDTAAARYTLSLRRWWVDRKDPDTCQLCPQPPHLSLLVVHKTEIVESVSPHEGNAPLTLWAPLSLGELGELIEAQRGLLARWTALELGSN
ncbi:MAG: hypothetical protein ACRDR6_03585 [Pseudonocardiaceae bacterium]